MSNGEWRNGLFSHVCGGSCGTCMAAWFCPCFLYGRIAQRLDDYPSQEDPGNCNGPCWLMCGASCCHLHWLVALFKRGDTRNKFGVKGDGCTDCLASYFCFPCTLAQMSTEVKDHARNGQHQIKQETYQPHDGMVYQQQPQQPQPGYQGTPKY